MSARVRDLIGGDVVSLGADSATFIGRSDHPKYPGLAMVVWRLSDGTVSIDALSYDQFVGVVTSSAEGYAERIEAALARGGQ